MNFSAVQFRELCREHDLVATHQRQMIYQTVMALPGHPSPEDIYESVRRQIPSISLATVYKNIQTFIENGMLQKVSTYHGPVRVEPNLVPHHHLVCLRCNSIRDIGEDEIDPVRLPRKLPRGFRAKRIAVDILGVCESCAAKTARKAKI